MRNKLFFTLFVIVLLLTITSLGIAQKETIRLSTWGGLYQESYMAGCKSFEEEYNVEIEYVLGDVPLWNAMARMGQVDVITSDVLFSIRGEKEGLYLPLDEEKMPNLANVYDNARLNEYTVWTNVGDFVMAYNKRHFASPPESWLEMWDDKYHQRVVLIQFDLPATLGFVVLLAELEGGGIDNIKPGIDKLAELYKKGNIITMVSADSETQNLLLLEEAWLAMLGNGRVYDSQQQGVDYVGLARPKEGTIGQISTIQIAKTTQKPDLAMALVNHILSKECMDIFTEKTRYSPTVSNATIPEGLEEVLLSGEDIDNLFMVDWARVDEVQDEWIKMWQRAVQ